MATFEELRDRALQVAGVTADAAKQLALVSKYRLQIAAEQEKVRALYTKLGKLYYKDFVTDEEPDEAEYQPLCDSISQHYRKISKLRDLMEEAKNNYQNVKSNCKNAKQQQEQEEARLIALASGTEEKDPLSEEESLLIELNNLNSQGYGEIQE